MFEIVDIDVSTNKKITAEQLRRAVGPILGTEQASTSGTEIDFTGIPAGVKRITIMFVGVSTNGTDPLLIQIGDSGGIEPSGYLGTGSAIAASSASSANYTTGFGLTSGLAANIMHGAVTLTLENTSAFTWVCFGAIGLSSGTAMLITTGSKSLSAELTQVRITTTDGTDAFDAGAINISYE